MSPEASEEPIWVKLGVFVGAVGTLLSIAAFIMVFLAAILNWEDAWVFALVAGLFGGLLTLPGVVATKRQEKIQRQQLVEDVLSNSDDPIWWSFESLHEHDTCPACGAEHQLSIKVVSETIEKGFDRINGDKLEHVDDWITLIENITCGNCSFHVMQSRTLFPEAETQFQVIIENGMVSIEEVDYEELDEDLVVLELNLSKDAIPYISSPVSLNVSGPLSAEDNRSLSLDGLISISIYLDSKFAGFLRERAHKSNPALNGPAIVDFDWTFVPSDFVDQPGNYPLKFSFELETFEVVEKSFTLRFVPAP